MEENKIKQRIIGAIVLVSLAVIFIPMILSGNRDQSMPLFGSPVPPKPDNVANIKVLEFTHTPQPPASREEIRTPVDTHDKKGDAPLASTQPEPTAGKTSTADSDDKPANNVDNKAVPLKAWAVQVGSFSNSTNATRLKDKLLKKGYRAFVERVTSNGKTSYRVRVGPEVRRDDAVALQKKIEQKMNIKGLVVTHP